MWTLSIVFLLISSYLLGSICSAVVVCHLCHLPDPRTHGSRNPGTTNVLRTSGKTYALVVLLGDALKGLIPVILAKTLAIEPQYWGVIGLAAVLGHMYPLFFHFKGGKGVATTLGVLLGLHGLLGAAVAVTWLGVALLSRYSSLAAILAIGLAPIYAYFSLKPSVVPVCVIALLVIYQHRDNIRRLYYGNEPKIK